MSDGDWVCSDQQCGNVNFARRTSCNRCGKEKSAIPPRKKLGHEIGKAAAEKSRGLFSADDWQCGRCGNVNWARRQQCNMCNAPKFGEVEERTGLGGGYNERENVEYIERDESDGEYDDFGRKKKKYRGNEEVVPKPKVVPPAAAAVVAKKASDEDNNKNAEEDEDDDDDDGDLSKYDLTGWGDDDDDEKDDKEKSGTKGPVRRARSRSHSSGSSRSSSSSSRSRSSSGSSQSSKSRSRSSSDTEARGRKRRARSRSRSSSIERNNNKRSAKSNVPSGVLKSKERSASNSPASYR